MMMHDISVYMLKAAFT